MTLKVEFSCLTFAAAPNSDGSIHVQAELETLVDGKSLLFAIARSIGVERTKKILELELREDEPSPPRIKMRKPSVIDLEQFLIPPDKIVETKVPDKAYALYRKGLREGIPTSIGKADELGWFIAQPDSSGDRLIKVWSEW